MRILEINDDNEFDSAAPSNDDYDDDHDNGDDFEDNDDDDDEVHSAAPSNRQSIDQIQLERADYVEYASLTLPFLIIS